MEIREYAKRILSSPRIEDKIAPPPGFLTDHDPGTPLFWTFPARPESLVIRTQKTRVPMPGPDQLADPRSRGKCLHFFANHELQALEIMAFALLAYPQAPARFRRELLSPLRDEARHLQIYIQRMKELGIAFGDLPISDNFWSKTKDLHTPLHYLATLSLTLEGANLDHLPYYEKLFREAGDDRTGDLFAQIYKDEIQHVHFGVQWMRELNTSDRSEWDVYCNSLKWPMRPQKARGKIYLRQGRVEAGMSESFIDQLEASFEA
ncbi:MAG: DUF455 family protein [Planctomycetota bacterium]|jgi:uncharacterized ferritin-like protein (DUF455 family)|nr:DUF455 family protein [Planctomycetota bacterium]